MLQEIKQNKITMSYTYKNQKKLKLIMIVNMYPNKFKFVMFGRG